MLKIRVLNVGHGDSIILEHEGPTGTVFGLIDSNHNGQGEPLALLKLRELGADRLSFVALTHPHADHYTGLAQVLEEYAGKVTSFFSFPMGHYLPGRLKKLANTYTKFHSQTESPTAKQRAFEFVKILSLVRKHIGLANWEELTGAANEIMPEGFAGVDIFGLLPPAKVKGYYFDLLETQDLSIIDGRQKENDLSLAFLLRYGGQKIILGGDGTYKNWLDHRRHLARKNGNLRAAAVKMPHHGSKYDCTKEVINHLFGGNAEAIALISADGRSHPHNETYTKLADAGIKPYCTNLARQCGANVERLVSIPEAAPVLRRLVNSIGDEIGGAQQPCQGDITVSISNAGVMNVVTEYNHPCPYRGGYDGLFN